MRGLKCIILQEVFDSRGVGQPEIVEKSRACEAYGAEVQQLSVGPELFYVLLRTLEETGFFNASLYTPFGIRGVETLGVEIARQVRERYGKAPGRRRHHPRRRRQPHRHGARPPGRGLRGHPHRRLLRRPRRPAHGLRHGLQPQELHDRPHRLRRPLRHLARPGRRPAQRRARACATWTSTSSSRQGEVFYVTELLDQARRARARPGRQHEPHGRRHPRPPDGPRPDRRRPGDRVHRRRQAPQPPALLRAGERHRGAPSATRRRTSRARRSSSPSGWTRCAGRSRTWTSCASRT